MFESHLYGIETWFRRCWCCCIFCLNRTFMELKQDGDPIKCTGWQCLNRTFMELKHRNKHE